MILIEAKLQGGYLAEGLDVGVDGGEVGGPVLGAAAVIAVGHEVEQRHVLRLVLVEVFLDIEALDGEFAVVKEDAEVCVLDIGVAGYALGDERYYIFLDNIENILGYVFGLNHDTKLRKIYEKITKESDLFA